MAGRVDLIYRGHRIIAGMLKGSPAAHVHVGARQVTAQPIEGASVEAAADAARAWVDARRADTVGQRRAPGIGTAEEYAAFFAAHPPAPHHRAMLVAHAAAADRTLSAGALARAAGWEDFGAANLHYGTLGDAVAQALELELPRHPDGSRIATAALAGSVDPDWKPVDGVFLWRLHEEVAAALAQLNIR